MKIGRTYTVKFCENALHPKHCPPPLKSEIFKSLKDPKDRPHRLFSEKRNQQKKKKKWQREVQGFNMMSTKDGGDCKRSYFFINA